MMRNKTLYLLIAVLISSCFTINHKKHVLNVDERGDKLSLIKMEGYYFREVDKQAYPYYSNEYGGKSEDETAPYQQKCIEPLILNKNGTVRVFDEQSGFQENLVFDFNQHCGLVDSNSFQSAKMHFECQLTNDVDRYSIWGKGVYSIDSSAILIQYYVNWRGNYYLQEKRGKILNDSSFILVNKFDYYLDKLDTISEVYHFQNYSLKPDSNNFITENPKKFGKKRK